MKTSVNYELVKKRFPKLRRLSAAIIAGQLEKLFGKEAVDELRDPLDFLEEQEELANALIKAEEDFLEKCENEHLRAGLLNLRTSNLPSLHDAFSKYADSPDNDTFRKFLQALLKKDFPILTTEEINAGADLYLRILRRRLSNTSPEARAKIVANTLEEINDKLDNLKVISTKLDILKPPDLAKKRAGLYPQFPPFLIGREHDMDELKMRLGLDGEIEKGIQRIISVRGLPGVGKTTIISALAFDEEIERAFPDGVLFTSLGQEPNFGTELAAWLRALGEEKIHEHVGTGEAKSILATHLKDKRMLLLIDDVWQSEHALPFLIGGPGCAVMLTTREKQIASELSPVPGLIYRLPLLNEEAALMLLTRIAPDVVKDYPEDARLLIRELQGLPLALRVAGNLLNEESESFSIRELIKEIQNIALLLNRKAPTIHSGVETETTPTVAALLQKSTDLLDEDTKRCYALLGLMAPKPATFGLDAMRVYWKVNDPKPIARILVKRGLLEYVRELECFQMHALLVAHAQTLFEEKPKSPRRRGRK